MLQFQHVLDDIELYNKSVHENSPITHNKKTRALIEKWQMNDGITHPVFPNPLGPENTKSNAEPLPQSPVVEKHFQNVLITKDSEPDGTTLHSLPTSTSSARNVCCIFQWTFRT